jgi:hypothetical protein
MTGNKGVASQASPEGMAVTDRTRPWATVGLTVNGKAAYQTSTEKALFRKVTP